MKSADEVLRAFDDLAEWPAVGERADWEPPLTPGQNLAALSRVSRAYAPDCLASVLESVMDERIPRGQIVVSHFASGLPAVLWSLVFERVFVLAPSRESCHGFENNGRIEVGFGDVTDAPFLYEVAERLRAPSALLLDEDRYYKLMVPYYLLKGRLQRPGICLLFNRAKKKKPKKRRAAARFMDDLRNASIDNLAHVVRPIDSWDDDPSAFIEVIR